MRSMGNELDLLRLLLSRLEKISADSVWAHRASGLRGAALRTLETVERGGRISPSHLRRLTQDGFRILEKAAEEKLR
ncbi:MAG: hypothetical protein Fur002_01600 [Anaerolineales bacterium]